MRALDQLAAVEVVDARVAGMHPVAVAGRVDQEGGEGAVRLLLGGDGGELDDQVRLLHHLLEQRRRVVVVGRVALEQLLGRHHDLVGGLAAAAAPAHAVGHDAQHAARRRADG